MSIWKWLWGKVWLLCKYFGIDLGRVAPWIFAQRIGCSKYEKVDSVIYICKCGHEIDIPEQDIHFIRCPKCGRVGQWIKEV